MTEAPAWPSLSDSARIEGRRSSAAASTSLRRRLVWLVLALAMPAIGLAAAGIFSAYRAERHLTASLLGETTRALANVVEGQIQQAEVVLKTLALSQAVRERDYSRFYEAAKQTNFVGATSIRLAEADGRVVVDTSVPFGAPIPAPACPETGRRAAERGTPELSGLCLEPGQDPTVVLWVPVRPGTAPAPLLSMRLLPDLFQALIAAQQFPAGWVAAVVDESGRFIVRSHERQPFLSQPIRPELLAAMRSTLEGDVATQTSEGRPVRFYFRHSAPYRWSFVIGYPAAVFSASVQQPLVWFTALAGAVALGLLFAGMLSHSIVRPVDRLLSSAVAVGEGQVVVPERTGVLEFDAVDEALAAASIQLRNRNLERDLANAAIQDREARLRVAMAAGRLGSWEYDPATESLTCSEVCKRHFGRAPDDAFSYCDLTASLHPDDRERQRRGVIEAVATGGDFDVTCRATWPDGSLHWIQMRGCTIGAAESRPTLIGVSQDITEARQAEEVQNLLLHELNHRVKNTLATVQSIAALTGRSAGDSSGLWDGFIGRLHGLAKTNDLLAAGNWKGADLRQTLASELDPYQDPLGQRIRLQGEPVSLSSQATLALGLAIHELATNAAKYGALSTPDGRLRVMWAEVRGEGPARLRWSSGSSGEDLRSARPSVRGLAPASFKGGSRSSLVARSSSTLPGPVYAA